MARPRLPDDPFILLDRNSGDTPHPFLVFDHTIGVITIADDYETTNDLTARDFGLSQEDAITLARALLLYAQDGDPSRYEPTSAFDVERALESWKESQDGQNTTAETRGSTRSGRDTDADRDCRWRELDAKARESAIRGNESAT